MCTCYKSLFCVARASRTHTHTHTHTHTAELLAGTIWWQSKWAFCSMVLLLCGVLSHGSHWLYSTKVLYSILCCLCSPWRLTLSLRFPIVWSTLWRRVDDDLWPGRRHVVVRCRAWRHILARRLQNLAWHRESWTTSITRRRRRRSAVSLEWTTESPKSTCSLRCLRRPAARLRPRGMVPTPQLAARWRSECWQRWKFHFFFDSFVYFVKNFQSFQLPFIYDRFIKRL